MKKGMDLYASQKRIKSKGYLRKHSHGSPCRKACKAGSGDSLQQSREVKEEERIIYEIIREEEFIEAHCEGQQGVQVTAERRCKAEEENHEIKVGEEKMKEKKSLKHKKHEAKESKAFEKKEDKKEKKAKR